MSEQNGNRGERALANLSPAAARLADSLSMDAERLALASRTLGADLKPDELHLFLAVAARQQLDPMSRQIYAWKDGGKLTIHISIDGRRAIAHRTGLVDGTKGPFWCGKDGVWKEVWTEADEPVAAKFEVFKKGASKSFPATALMKTYRRNTGRWLSDPVGMLAKVSEDHAWRRAFPYEMGGLPSYAPEHDQGAEEAPAVAAEPQEHEEGEYREVDQETGEITHAGPAWAGTPLGQEVSALVDQLTEAGARFSPPADDADEETLRGWIAAKRGLLRQKA